MKVFKFSERFLEDLNINIIPFHNELLYHLYNTEKYGFYRDTFENIRMNLLENKKGVNKINNDLNLGQYYVSECIKKNKNNDKKDDDPRVHIVRYSDNKIFLLPILSLKKKMDHVNPSTKMYDYYISFIKKNKGVYFCDFNKKIDKYNQINSVVYMYNIIESDNMV
jgi:hypothetical protein